MDYTHLLTISGDEGATTSPCLHYCFGLRIYASSRPKRKTPEPRLSNSLTVVRLSINATIYFDECIIVCYSNSYSVVVWAPRSSSKNISGFFSIQIVSDVTIFR
jgi:hypothetical protein